MTFKFHCQCGQRVSATEDLIGTVADCPNCGKPITVPRPEELPPPAPLPEAEAAPAPADDSADADPAMAAAHESRRWFVVAIVVLTACLIWASVLIYRYPENGLVTHISTPGFTSTTIRFPGLDWFGFPLGLGFVALIVAIVRSRRSARWTVLAIGLAAISATSYLAYRAIRDARFCMRAIRHIQELKICLAAYKSDLGHYPAGDSGAILKSLIEHGPKSSAPLHSVIGALTDPWGSPYRILLNKDREPQLTSAGKNRVFEDGKTDSDDIQGWESLR